MTKLERVLSDSELLDVYRSLDNPKHDRDSVIGAMAAAVDAAMRKLTGQEPSDDAIYVLKLALEYWADRQQRYRNRAPVWVQKARALLAHKNGEE